MNLLCLDLGTQLGWAVHARGFTVSGSTGFGRKSNETHNGGKWRRFRQFLNERADSAGEFNAVYVEGLIHMPSNTLQTIVSFGGFMATLEAWCSLRNLPLHVVNVSSIKKHWTGKGNAKKADMLRVFAERGVVVKDDNEADALALLDYAMCLEGSHTPTAIESIPLIAKKTPFDDPFAKA